MASTRGRCILSRFIKPSSSYQCVRRQTAHYMRCYRTFLTTPSSRQGISNTLNASCSSSMALVDTVHQQCLDLLLTGDLVVIPDFINEQEEDSIMSEIQPYMSRLRYEYSHWDDAIHGYRETERTSWNSDNQVIIDRLKRHSFPEEKVSCPTNYVHVLDLEASGEIKAHKDSVRYCGDTISGISLLSDCVMRLAREDDKNVYIDLLLKRRSLYIMRYAARYDYTHAILHNNVSQFKGEAVVKDRRISIICRNMPAAKSQ